MRSWRLRPICAPSASGRNFAAWLGLVPRQRSTGGKTRLGGVSKMGQTDIRKLLIVGAMSRIRWIIRKGVLPDNWLGQLVGPQAAHGRGRRAGQQDGPDHLGDDDEGAELPDGVSGRLLDGGKAAKRLGATGPGKEID